jgi:hypothetical protein
MSFPTYFSENFDFNLDGTPSQIPQNSQRKIDDLPLAELLKHPSVMELYRQNQALQTSQIKFQETQSKLAEFAEKSFALQEKNIVLQSQISSLESELSAAKMKANALSTEIHSLQANL